MEFLSFLKGNSRQYKTWVLFALLTSLASITLFMNCSPMEEDFLGASSASPVPDFSHLIESLSKQYPTQFSNACSNWDFIDLVVTELRKQNERFGYNCESGDCDHISTNQVAFYMGPETECRLAEGSTDVLVVNVVNCSSRPKTDWTVQDPHVNGRWKYSRQSDSSFEAPSDCILPPPPTTTTTTLPGGTTSTLPGGSSSSSTTTTPSTTIDPATLCDAPNQLSVLQGLVNDYSEELSESKNCNDDGTWEFLDEVVEELRETDKNWGYYYRTDVNQWSTDAIGYYCGTETNDEGKDGSHNFRFVDVLPSECEGVVWQVDEEGSRSNRGQWRYPGPTDPQNTCVVPDESSEVEKIATEYPQDLINTDCHNVYADSDWAFLDKVLEKLQSKDRRWGYHCNEGDCTDLSKDAIAFYCGEGTPNSSSTRVRVIDIVTRGEPDKCQTSWIDDTEDRGIGRWKYPRPDDAVCEVLEPDQWPEDKKTECCEALPEDQRPDVCETKHCHTPGHYCYEQKQIVTQAINNICSTGQTANDSVPSFSWDTAHLLHDVIHTTDIRDWKETSTITSAKMDKHGFCLRHTQESEWRAESESDRFNGALFTFIPYRGKIYVKQWDFINGKQIPGCTHHPWVWQIDDGISHNIKTATINFVIGLMRIHLTGPVAERGRAPIRGWYPTPGGIMGFAVSSDTEKKGKKERSDIVWFRVPNYCQVSSGGSIVGRYSDGLVDSCDAGNCKCIREDLPFSEPASLAKGGREMRGFGINEEHCTDSNSNVLPITVQVEDVERCCRISSKTECPDGYTHTNGNCFPSCQKAAEFAGYGGSGHYVLDDESSCGDVTEGGYSWEDFEFYDPLKFPKQNQKSQSTRDVANIGSSKVCCAKSGVDPGTSPSSPPVHYYQDNGVYLPPSTTTDSCDSDDDYDSQSACENNLPSDKECYQDGSCWKRRDINDPYRLFCFTKAACEQEIPEDEECYEDTEVSPNCWKRRDKGSASAPECGSRYQCDSGTVSERSRFDNRDGRVIEHTWKCTHKGQPKTCFDQESVECFEDSHCTDCGGIPTCQGNVCECSIP